MQKTDEFDQYLTQAYNFNEKEVEKIKSYSVNRDVDEIRKRIKHINTFLGCKKGQTAKIIYRLPQILDMPLTGRGYSFDENCHFLMSTLGLSKKQLASILVYAPGLCALDLRSRDVEAFPDRLHFYRQTFNASNEEVGQMLYKLPKLFTLPFSKRKNSITEKIEKINEIGFPAAYVKKNPEILMVNSDRIKLRYMILKLSDPQKSNFKNPTLTYPKGLTLDEDKSYARMRLMQNKYTSYFSSEKKPSGWLFLSSSRFEAETGIDDKELVKQYPLTQERAKEVENKYNQRAVIKLHLTQDELKHLPSEAEAD